MGEWIKANKGFVIFCFVFLLIIVFFLYLKFGDNLGINVNMLFLDIKDNNSNSKNYTEDYFANSISPHWTHMPITFMIQGEVCNEYFKGRLRRAFNILSNETNGAVTFKEIEDKKNYSKPPDEFKEIEILIKAKPYQELAFTNYADGTSFIFVTNDYGAAIINSSMKNGEASFELTRTNLSEKTDYQKFFYRIYNPNEKIILDFNLPQEEIPLPTTIIETKEERKGEVDLFIRCHSKMPVELNNYDEISTTLGLAQIKDISDNQIKYATIDFYKISKTVSDYSGGCQNYPSTELHEILHTFGYGHSNDSKNLMAPYDLGCSGNELDETLINGLKEVYS